MDIEITETTNSLLPKSELIKLDEVYLSKKLLEASQMLDENQPELKDSFWTIKASKKKDPSITLHLARFNLFLQRHGFYKLYQGKSKIFVQVKNNIITEITIDQIKDFIRNYIESLPEEIDVDNQITREDLLEKVYNNAARYLSDGNLSFLKCFEPDFKKDSSSTGYLFFENCFVEVTKKGIASKDYCQLQGHIWKNQVRNRRFEVLNDSEKGDFEKLVFNVSNQEQARFTSTCSAIGYLLHSYKDQALSKAVIFADEKIATDDASNGGTCKSLVAKGIEMLKFTWYRGKDYRIDKPFPYQGITLATQICLLDDTPKNFNFEQIFTNITNSLTVEGKGQAAFSIDYNDSPKWLITTNYVIKGEGSSFDRRRHIVEFSDYYNQNPRPIEEFGRRLFDWPAEEWNRFDNFMLHCLQLYLAHGLQEIQVNYKERVLLQNTSEEFVAFMDDLSPEEEYKVKELKENFCIQYEDYCTDRTFTTRIFCQWIRLYLKHKQIVCQGDISAKDKLTGNKNKPFEERNGNKYLKMLSHTPA